MLDIATERAHLAKAERDLVAGEARIARQAALVERLRPGGEGVEAAEALLETLRQSLLGWRAHRDEILRTIARLESGAF